MTHVHKVASRRVLPRGGQTEETCECGATREAEAGGTRSWTTAWEGGRHCAVVFLDFDGVLNSHEWFRRRGPRPGAGGLLDEASVRWRLDPATAPRLNRLADAGARFVISSTWRMSGLLEMQIILRHLGMRGDVIGCTPDLSVKDRSIYVNHARNRGAEIQAWIVDVAFDGPFVIIDDDDDMGPLLDRLVQTDERTGLLDEHIDRALAILRGSP